MNPALPSENRWAIQASGLTKFFGPAAALRDVDLEIAYSQSVAIVGPNGAGKSTMLRILATLMRPSSGRVWINGRDVRQLGAKARQCIGFGAHQTLLYGDLSPAENLRFYARMYAVVHAEERIQELLAKVELTERQNEPVRTLSRGMQQRLAIARSILHRPRILLLDEPFTGLDQRAAAMVAELLRSLLAEGCTLLMSTHEMKWAAGLSDRVLILSAGRVIHQAQSTGLSATQLIELYQRHVEGRQ